MCQQYYTYHSVQGRRDDLKVGVHFFRLNIGASTKMPCEARKENSRETRKKIALIFGHLHPPESILPPLSQRIFILILGFGK